MAILVEDPGSIAHVTRPPETGLTGASNEPAGSLGEPAGSVRQLDAMM